jgi:hypothetical protein
MDDRSFTLQPFHPAIPHPAVQVTGAIVRRADHLAIRYDLLGELSALALPAPAAQSSRRLKLWEETCFEFFLAVKYSPRYWEFNFSPAGHWNVYAFAGYRQGMQEEKAFTALPFTVQQGGDSMRLALELEVGRIIPASQALEVAISAVLKSRNGQATYWALSHPGPQADFHRRDGFIITL